jgi:hypothetical protein
MFGIEFSTFYGYAVLRKSVANIGINDLWELYLDGKLILPEYSAPMPDLNSLRDVMLMKESLNFFLDNTVGATQFDMEAMTDSAIQHLQ